MKRWKILKIYLIEAETKTEALTAFGKANSPDEFLMTVVVTEAEPGGLWRAVKQQLTG